MKVRKSKKNIYIKQKLLQYIYLKKYLMKHALLKIMIQIIKKGLFIK